MKSIVSTLIIVMLKVIDVFSKSKLEKNAPQMKCAQLIFALEEAKKQNVDVKQMTNVLMERSVTTKINAKLLLVLLDKCNAQTVNSGWRLSW